MPSNNNAAIISINANSLKDVNVPDYGRSTGYRSVESGYVVDLAQTTIRGLMTFWRPTSTTAVR